jgi:hypothetical protein
MEAVGGIGSFSTSISNFSFPEIASNLPNVSKVNLDNQLVKKKDSDPLENSNCMKNMLIERYTCTGCYLTLPNIDRVIKHHEEVHGEVISFQEAYRRSNVTYTSVKIYHCGACKKEYLNRVSFQSHIYRTHKRKPVFHEGGIISFEYYDTRISKNKAFKTCNICYQKFNTVKDKQDHLQNFNHANYFKCTELDCSRAYSYYKSLKRHCLNDHNKVLKYNKKEYCGLLIKFRSMFETQDNTDITNTTMDNMDSTRKRSHSPAIHEEEPNAKKASLNTLESGYLQSLATLSSISNSCEEDPIFSDRFLDGIIADDSFVTPVAGNTASINTDFQFSDTSQDIDDKELLELARELAENNSDFQDALNKDVADKYATSRDSYLQFSVTPIVISDDNVTSFSWCDDYINDTLAGN